jgi:hypothetical protein
LSRAVLKKAFRLSMPSSTTAIFIPSPFAPLSAENDAA